jgi:LysR family carnitine catabolism transcriptional activator
MDRRHLEHFLAVAESGSFTRAAAVLNVAQPSLSHSIAALERELGSKLFERLGRGVRLTPAGQVLLEPARRTMRSFALARGAVRGVSDAGFGRLSVISHTLWAIEPLVQVIGEFRQLHPAVQFTITDPAHRSDVLESVRSGSADFGLLDGTPPGGVLSSQWLVDQELVAVLPARALNHLMSVSISDLVPLGLISTPPGTGLRALVDGQLEAAGESPDVAVETAHVATLIPLVLAGAGASILPEGLAAEAAAKGARILRLSPARRVSVSIFWRPDRLSGVGEHFLTVARELFSGTPHRLPHLGDGGGAPDAQV